MISERRSSPLAADAKAFREEQAAERSLQKQRAREEVKLTARKLEINTFQLPPEAANRSFSFPLFLDEKRFLRLIGGTPGFHTSIQLCSVVDDKELHDEDKEPTKPKPKESIVLQEQLLTGLNGRSFRLSFLKNISPDEKNPVVVGVSPYRISYIDQATLAEDKVIWLTREGEVDNIGICVNVSMPGRQYRAMQFSPTGRYVAVLVNIDSNIDGLETHLVVIDLLGDAMPLYRELPAFWTYNDPGISYGVTFVNEQCVALLNPNASILDFFQIDFAKRSLTQLQNYTDFIAVSRNRTLSHLWVWPDARYFAMQTQDENSHDELRIFQINAKNTWTLVKTFSVPRADIRFQDRCCDRVEDFLVFQEHNRKSFSAFNPVTNTFVSCVDIAELGDFYIEHVCVERSLVVENRQLARVHQISEVFAAEDEEQQYQLLAPELMKSDANMLGINSPGNITRAHPVFRIISDYTCKSAWLRFFPHPLPRAFTHSCADEKAAVFALGNK